MSDPSRRRTNFGIMVAVVSGGLLVMAMCAAPFGEQARPVVFASLGIGSLVLLATWIRVLTVRCSQCGQRAFLRGSLWFGSSLGVLGSKCVHCGSRFDRE